LRAALADLAKEPDYAELTAQYTKFALDLEGHLKFHRCTELTGELSELDKSIAKATAVVAAEADAEKKKPLQAALAALNADKTNLTKQRADTGRFLSNACAVPITTPENTQMPTVNTAGRIKNLKKARAAAVAVRDEIDRLDSDPPPCPAGLCRGAPRVSGRTTRSGRSTWN